MKRLSTFTIFFALLALLSACAVLAAPPPPQSKLFKLDRPAEGTTYKVGQQIQVHATSKGGKKSEIYKKNPDVKLLVQTTISLPDVNEIVADKVPYRTLADKGFRFKVKEEYLSTRPTASYRVRASFYVDGKHGYVDSPHYYLKKK
ncbi:hypothetical protein BGW42_004824 [Actinomortierella wolfii]|nr:hypothetical protein BGW42_004824 [Actinomortierella wolfii]KAG0227068.1 hypothetical protein BGW41_003990 [Actinomortierella wolfii]